MNVALIRFRALVGRVAVCACCIGALAAICTRIPGDHLFPFVELMREWSQSCSVIALPLFVISVICALLGEIKQKYAFVALFSATIGFAIFGLAVLPVVTAPVGGIFNPLSQSKLQILILNTFHSNNDATRFSALVKRENPDIVGLVEVSKTFLESFDASEFPHHYSEIGERGFGIALFSKRPFAIEQSEKRLAAGSIRYALARFGKASSDFYFLLVHPDPPITTTRLSLRNNFLTTAAELFQNKSSGIIAGDFNTTEFSSRFQELLQTAEMSDANRGFGFFNTWRLLEFPFLRFSIDHLIYKGPFNVLSVQRLEDVGSDHYPILYELAVRKN